PFATTKSGYRSWLRSPAATATGKLPAGEVVGGFEGPAPLPRITPTLPVLALLVVVSGFRCRLKSATPGGSGSVPSMSYGTPGRSVPSPRLSMTSTVFAYPNTRPTTTSGQPSLLTSATASDPVLPSVG